MILRHDSDSMLCCTCCNPHVDVGSSSTSGVVSSGSLGPVQTPSATRQGRFQSKAGRPHANGSADPVVSGRRREVRASSGAGFLITEANRMQVTGRTQGERGQHAEKTLAPQKDQQFISLSSPTTLQLVKLLLLSNHFILIQNGFQGR